ncbi:MAG: hypothetical protein ACRDF9_08145 [Candidatus Limnocylindria bacterium]
MNVSLIASIAFFFSLAAASLAVRLALDAKRSTVHQLRRDACGEKDRGEHDRTAVLRSMPHD